MKILSLNRSAQWRRHIQQFSRRFSHFNLQEPIKVLVGTQTGTAMGFAQNLADAAHEKGISNIQVIDLEEYEPKDLEKERQIIFIMACYGTGEPTDNAKNLYSTLMKDEIKKLPKLHYTIFGLGSSKTHKQNYNVIAKNVDKKLEEIGAKRVFHMGLGDDSGCIEIDFQNWQDQFLEKLSNPNALDSSSTTSTTSSSTETSSSDVCPAEPVITSFTPSSPEVMNRGKRDLMNVLKQGGFLKSNTVMFPVSYNAMLNTKYVDSMLEMHLEAPQPISTSESKSPFSYETGDHIGIYPTNDSQLVNKLASRLNYPLNDFVQFTSNNPNRKAPFPNGITVKEVLSNCLEIQCIPKPLGISQLAAYSKNPQEKAQLDLIAKNPELYKERIWKNNRHLIDLLDEFPSVQLSFYNLTQVVPPLQPRYYSISSSSLEHPQEVHITYRWVHYYNSVIESERQGVTTQYLKNFIPSEHKNVFGFMRTSTFRQPVDTTLPVIMIAGGSGIAPLKAFLQERLFRAKNEGVKYGTGLLFFGVRNPEDLVYNNLIQDCLKTGALTEAHISFSSPSDQASYTPRFVAQDVRENSKSIWRAISDGGFVYMCGGASAFANSCGRELRQVFQTGGHLDSQGADDYLLSLIRQKRYMEDLSD